LGIEQSLQQSRTDYRPPSPYGSSANGSDAPFLQPPEDHGDDYGAPGIGGGSVFISQNMHHSQQGLNSSGVTQAVTRGGLHSHSAHGHSINVDSVGKTARLGRQDAAAASQQWKEAHSSSGKRYYYNIVTQESTYRRPHNYTPIA
jgi:hypothetical protein